jgi:hypothetical protein
LFRILGTYLRLVVVVVGEIQVGTIFREQW